MHVVTVKFTIQSHAFAAFLGLARQQRLNSLAQSPGCRVFDIAHDEKSHVLLYELYEHRENFTNHLQTPHFQNFAAATAKMVVAKQVEEWTYDRPTNEPAPSA